MCFVIYTTLSYLFFSAKKMSNNTQCILLGDVSTKIYDFIKEFSDLASLLMVSKDFYELRWKITWDKDYVNIDFIYHLDYYNRFTKIILPFNFFEGKTQKVLPKHAQKIKFFDFLPYAKNYNGSDKEFMTSPKYSYKTFNDWIQSPFLRTYPKGCQILHAEDFHASNHLYYKKFTVGTFDIPLSPCLHTLENITKIKFTSSVTKGITSELLPKNLKTLILSNHYNEPFTSETFPKGLKKLHMGWVYNYELKPDHLPEGLEHLILSHNYNIPLIPDVLPKSITYLKLGTNYNNVFEPGVLHEGLKILELGELYKETFPKNAFPNSLDQIIHPEKFWDKSTIQSMYRHQTTPLVF